MGVQLRTYCLINKLPRPVSSKAEDIRAAAQDAAASGLRGPAGTFEMGSSSSSSGSLPTTVGLSPSQIQAINESPLDSPKMWMELAEALLIEPPITFSNHYEMNDWEEGQYDSLWDS
ncbi:hypothetical protein HHK36_030294 [Tetracentron sinense]|uniref:Uncharacterized protein n=1 Tax=Tetracentron sinense TaxID=13715 RepID=A0A834Y965_TETSI|nr:hypothetical protein HHK36_030294 [Tetracentron sinense]